MFGLIGVTFETHQHDHTTVRLTVHTGSLSAYFLTHMLAPFSVGGTFLVNLTLTVPQFCWFNASFVPGGQSLLLFTFLSFTFFYVFALEI